MSLKQKTITCNQITASNLDTTLYTTPIVEADEDLDLNKIVEEIEKNLAESQKAFEGLKKMLADDGLLKGDKPFETNK